METSSKPNGAIFILNNHDNSLDTKHSSADIATLFDDDTHFINQVVFFVVLSCFFGMFGTVTNIINITIFIRQGLFSGGSTLNLFFLAVADLGVVFTNFIQSIGFVLVVANIPGLSWDPFDVFYLIVGWPHTIFIVVNRILTAYVAFERCMCVVIPFKVQRLFTPRRSLVYILIIYSYCFVSHVPIYATHGLGYRDQEGTNSTKLVLVYGPNWKLWHEIVYYANFFVLSFLSVITVLVCTVITSAKVTTSKEWRKTMNSKMDAPKTTNSENTRACDDMVGISTGDQKTNKKMTASSKDKEKKLVKMITTISIIFLVCYLPELVFILMRSIDERIQFSGQYYRLSHLMYSITFVAATINSGFNIFVYYNMSSKYKKECMIFFGRNTYHESNE